MKGLKNSIKGFVLSLHSLMVLNVVLKKKSVLLVGNLSPHRMYSNAIPSSKIFQWEEILQFKECIHSL